MQLYSLVNYICRAGDSAPGIERFPDNIEALVLCASGGQGVRDPEY